MTNHRYLLKASSILFSVHFLDKERKLYLLYEWYLIEIESMSSEVDLTSLIKFVVTVEAWGLGREKSIGLVVDMDSVWVSDFNKVTGPLTISL